MAVKLLCKWIGIMALIVLVGGCAAKSPGTNISPGTSNQPNASNQTSAAETKTDTARFNGQIDSNSIEVNISGVPEAQGTQALRLSEPVKQALDSYHLNTGDTIKFEYNLNEQGQKVVTKLEVITRAAPATKTESGRFWGQIDSNSVEIKISGVPDTMPPRVFRLSEEIKASFAGYSLKQGDVIKFNFITNENGQMVIVKLDRI